MPIDLRHQDLWARIVTHRFDDPTARLTFTARLARENGWTIRHACRVVDEYRRFVFLAVTAGHSVTPSEDVDQAWHLHLAYTRDYWETFCRDVLGGPLHHGPTRGGAREADRYDTQYRQTLAAYSIVFDATPPEDIWPGSERRFGEDLAWQRVNVARNWVIPKPSWLTMRPRSNARLTMLAAMPLVALGIPNPLNFTAGPFLALFTMLATGAIVVGLALRQVFRPVGNPTVAATDVEPLELALLAKDGRLRFAAVGLAMLAVKPAQPSANSVTDPAAPIAIPSVLPLGSSPLLAALHTRLVALGACPPVDAIKAAVDMAGDEVEPRLVERGLLVGGWWDTFAPWIILGPVFGTGALGVAKIYVETSRGEDVGFFVFGCATLALVSFVAIARKPRRTQQGDAVVHAALKRDQESGQQDAWYGHKPTQTILPLAVALLGTTALAGTAHSSLLTALNTLSERASSGGGGCGTTGGDGGGCGGCGD